MIRTIRQSEIRAFKQCRRNWMLGYHQQLQKKQEFVTPGIRELGTLVHLGLERYYGYTEDVDETLDAQWALVEEADKDRLLGNYTLARIMLQGYIQHVQDTGIDAGWRILSTERQIEYPFGTILGDEIVLTGKIDMEIVDEYDIPRFVDHKTVQTFDIGRQLSVDDQLLTYAVLRRLEGVQFAGAIYNMLRKVKRSGTAKPPFYDRLPVTFNDTQLDNHYATLHGVLTDLVNVSQRLEAGESMQTAAYTNPNRDCSWRCDFIGACAMMSDGSDYAGYLETYFERRDILAPERKEESE